MNAVRTIPLCLPLLSYPCGSSNMAPKSFNLQRCVFSRFSSDISIVFVLFYFSFYFQLQTSSFPPPLYIDFFFFLCWLFQSHIFQSSVSDLLVWFRTLFSFPRPFSVTCCFFTTKTKERALQFFSGNRVERYPIKGESQPTDFILSRHARATFDDLVRWVTKGSKSIDVMGGLANHHRDNHQSRKGKITRARRSAISTTSGNLMVNVKTWAFQSAAWNEICTSLDDGSLKEDTDSEDARPATLVPVK